jgi:eukaryotic-like serine/threonine-protein kinase
MAIMGHLVDGRYAITYRVHVGRTATIYLARDQFLHRSVVLKMLHPSLATDPAHIERFRRAACAAAAVSHPNLIAVYNLGTYAGTYYIVMEHVTGPSLSQSLQIGGRVSETRALQIAAQVAAALAAAHERGIVHGDIRSHNILLAAGGQVKVTDFGCASTTGICAPDPAYTAIGDGPHQQAAYALPLPADGRSDLYNLGLMLHEMVTGMPVREADGAPRYADALSPYTDAIVRHALAPNVALRFPNANAMHAAIEHGLAQIASGIHDLSVRAPIYAADSQPRMSLIGLFRPRSTRLAS